MTPESSPASSTIPQDPAIARCYSAWQRVYRAEKEKGKSLAGASINAAQAYRSVMPPLSGQDNIRDFIACVAHGMLIGAIEGKNGTKLLYAAQVALATVRREPSPPRAGA